MSHEMKQNIKKQSLPKTTLYPSSKATSCAGKMAKIIKTLVEQIWQSEFDPWNAS